MRNHTSSLKSLKGRAPIFGRRAKKDGTANAREKGGGGSYQPFFARMNLTPEERLEELKRKLETLGLLKKA